MYLDAENDLFETEKWYFSPGNDVFRSAKWCVQSSKMKTSGTLNEISRPAK